MSIHSRVLKSLITLDTREKKHELLLNLLKNPEITRLYPSTEATIKITTHPFFIALKNKNYLTALLLPHQGNSLLHLAAEQYPNLMLDLLTFTMEEEIAGELVKLNPFLLDINLQNHEGKTLLHVLLANYLRNPRSYDKFKQEILHLFDHYQYEINPFIKNAAGQTIAHLFNNNCPQAPALFKLLNANHCFIGTQLQFDINLISENFIFAMTSKLAVSSRMPHTLVIKDYIDLLLSISIDKSFSIKRNHRHFKQSRNSLCLVEKENTQWVLHYCNNNGKLTEFNIDNVSEISALLGDIDNKKVRQQIEYYSRIHFGSIAINGTFSYEDLVILRHRLYQCGNQILQENNLSLNKTFILQNMSMLEGALTALLHDKERSLINEENGEEPFHFLTSHPLIVNERHSFNMQAMSLSYQELKSTLKMKLLDLDLLKNYLQDNKAKYKINGFCISASAIVVLPLLGFLASALIIGLNTGLGITHNLFGTHEEPYTYTTNVYNSTTGVYDKETVNSIRNVPDNPGWAAYCFVSYVTALTLILICTPFLLCVPLLLQDLRFRYKKQMNSLIDDSQLAIIVDLLRYFHENNHYFSTIEMANFPQPDTIATLGLEEALALIKKLSSSHKAVLQFIKQQSMTDALFIPMSNSHYPQTFFNSLREQEQIKQANQALVLAERENDFKIEGSINYEPDAAGEIEIEIPPFLDPESNEGTPLLANNRYSTFTIVDNNSQTTSVEPRLNI